MRVLLDTHAFLWWTEDSYRLSEFARATINAGENDIVFSVVSAWEIAVKVSLEKLALPGSPDEVIPEEIRKGRMEILPIEIEHALRLHNLPLHHRDPFDRMLVAQAIAEEIPSSP